jgi:hypothetical protein
MVVVFQHYDLESFVTQQQILGADTRCVAGLCGALCTIGLPSPLSRAVSWYHGYCPFLHYMKEETEAQSG